jgi:CubicO group peptidase (beta-lactamase class C family)
LAQDQGRPPAPPALVGMGLPEVPPEQVEMSKQKLDRIHDAFNQHVADGKLPGTVVLVARKGNLIYADVTGFPDKDEGQPMVLDSLFRIYSMTKPLVSVAAMMLVEDGTIQLTDPVSKFFPAFKGQQVSVARSDNELARMSYITVAAEREMTVQDLLRHTAGLAYGEITVNTPVRDAYAKTGLYLAGVRDYDARELTPAEELERLAKAPLAHEVICRRAASNIHGSWSDGGRAFAGRFVHQPSWTKNDGSTLGHTTEVFFCQIEVG